MGPGSTRTTPLVVTRFGGLGPPLREATNLRPVATSSGEVSEVAAAATLAELNLDSLAAYRPSLLIGGVEGPPPGESRSIQLAALLERAGLSLEDAWQIAYHGLDAQKAKDLMNLSLLQPTMEQYGAAAVTVRILSEAIGAGAVSPARLRQLIATYRDAVVLRPDGVLAKVVDGTPIERRSDLTLGATYHLRQGVLRELSPAGELGPIAAELGLERGPVGAALDGVTEALMDGVIGLAKLTVELYERPEETIAASVDAFGRLPDTLVRFIRQCPELCERFANLPKDDQIQAVAKWITTAFLMLQGGRAAASGGASVSGPSFGLDLMALADGGLVLAGGVEAAAFTRMGTQLALTAVLMSAVGDEAKAREKARSGAARAFGDLSDRSAHPLRDLNTVLDLAEKLPPPTRLGVARMIAARLAQEAALVPLDELAELTHLAGRLGEAFAAEITAAVNQRMKSEVQAILELPADSRRSRAIKALRSTADRAGIDLRAALRPGTPVAPLESLSPGARRAIQRLEAGETEVTVASKAEALEVLSQYPNFVDTSNWGWEMIKGLLGTKRGDTFHWDDVFGTDGRILFHGPENIHGTIPHLQLEYSDKSSRRIFFPKERS